MGVNTVNKILIFLLALTLIHATASAVESEGLTPIQLGNETQQMAMEEVLSIAADMGVDLNSIDINLTVIIVGENLDAAEKTSLSYAQIQFPEFFDNLVYASDLSFEDVENSTRLFMIAGRQTRVTTVEPGTKWVAPPKTISVVDTSKRLIILIGGTSQNKITREFSARGLLEGDRRELMNQMVVVNGRTTDGTKFIVVSDKKGFENIERKAVEYSPLSLCLPVQWVPIIASLIGAVSVSLLNLLKGYVESLIMTLGKKNKTINHNASKILGIKIREVIALGGASLVLGLAMTWTYAGPTSAFILLLVLNVVLCVIGVLSYEILNRLMAKILKIKAEYKFWWSGSIATVITAFLGNSFGLQGFLIHEIEENTPKWKVGVMKLISITLMTFIMIFFAILNFFFPHVSFQMIYSISGMLAMAQSLPVIPMDGYDIRKWNILIWLAAFLFIATSFFTISFIL